MICYIITNKHIFNFTILYKTLNVIIDIQFIINTNSLKTIVYLKMNYNIYLTIVFVSKNFK